MSPLNAIAEELRELGYKAEVIHGEGFNGSSAVAIDYPVSTGQHKGKTFRIAIAFQEDAYPEYPPHFIYVKEIPSPKNHPHSSFDYENSKWTAFSSPPNDFWDGLPTPDKNMKTYIKRHMTRFWDQI